VTARQHDALWHLDEADRLDQWALKVTGMPKPDPVANIAAMDFEWVARTLGPDGLRRAAEQHRAVAARMARAEIEARTRKQRRSKR
jgi:hypothetical protein